MQPAQESESWRYPKLFGIRGRQFSLFGVWRLFLEQSNRAGTWTGTTGKAWGFGGRTPGGQKQAQTPRQRERETGDLARGERFEAGRGAHWGPTGVCYSGRGPLQNVDLGVVPVTLPPTTNLKKKTCQRTFKNRPPSHGLLHVNSMGQCHLSSLGAVWETPSPRGDFIAERAKRFNASSTPPPLFF